MTTLFKLTLVALASVLNLASGLVFAQSITSSKDLPVVLATQAALEAMVSCEKQGHKVSVTVLDRNGLTRVVLKSERATPHTLDSSRGKAYTLGTLGPLFKKDLQSELVQFLGSNPAAAAIVNVPGILLLPGAVSIKVGDELVGTLGVSGAPSGLTDEACARAGLERIASSLK